MSVVIAGDIPNPDAPRLLWDKIAGTIAASTAAALYDAAFANAPQTYTGWKPTAVPATWSITPDAPVPVDACGVGVHGLAGAEATIFVEYYDGATWVEVASATPADNTALLFLFPRVESAEAWRVRVTGGVAEIGVIIFGLATVFPRNSRFAPLTPITEAENYTYSTNRTDGGSWAGRSTASTGLTFTVTVSNLSEEFTEGDAWRNFKQHANTGDATFFIAPKPESYPREVAYAWSKETVRAPRTVANRGISREVELNCEGYRSL